MINNGSNKGSLRECTDLKTGKVWMVEMINKNIAIHGEKYKVERSFETLKSMDHPTLIRQHELIDTDGYLYIVKELCTAPSLFDFLLTKPVMEEVNAADLIK